MIAKEENTSLESSAKGKRLDSRPELLSDEEGQFAHARYHLNIAILSLCWIEKRDIIHSWS